jgi:hypothetical protein
MPRRDNDRRDDDREIVKAILQTLTSETGLNLADGLFAIAEGLREIAAALAGAVPPAEYEALPVEEGRPIVAGDPAATQPPPAG